MRAALASALILGFGPLAWAIDMTPLTPGRTNPFETPAREYNALPLGAWLLYPELFVGVVFDTNPRQSAAGAKSTWGLEVSPRLTGVWNDGIHKLTVYGLLDGRVYTQNNAGQFGNSNAQDILNVRTGFEHVYEAQRDLVFRFSGDYTRQTDVFSGSSLWNPNVPIVPSPIVVTPTNNPSFYNQFTGSGSVLKNFAQFFVGFGGNVTNTTFDNANNLTGTNLSGTVFTVSGRAGSWVMPVLYAYVEPSLDWRRYDTSAFDSHGYRVVGGLGTDQFGLFRGEIYAGYQGEQFENTGLLIGTNAVPNVSGTVYGGRVYYYPTPYWNVRGTLDEQLGVSGVATPVSAVGTSTRTTTGILSSDYSIWETWTLGGRFGYARTDYVNAARLDNAWLAGATVGHKIWGNLAATLDYQFTKSDSNVPLKGFTRSVIIAGVTYKY